MLTSWKNTGETAVRVVEAEIQTFNADGSVRDTINYSLYADFNENPGVAPGQIYSQN